MAFAVVAVTLLATCFQSSFAAVVTETAASASTTTTAVGPTMTAPAVSPLGIMNGPNAVNSMNPVNYLYNSPYIPTDPNYGVDLLNDYPHFLPCDCYFGGLIDPARMDEMALITTRYNQRPCSLQQWERLINKNMPGIDNINALNMVSSLASAVQREQIRRDLVYGNYPEVCLNHGAALNDVATTNVATSTTAATTVLARREPQAPVATATASATTTTVTSAPAPWANTQYMYTMQYLFDRALPNLSADLRLDVINSVLANTPAAHWSNAYPLAQQLTSNIRGMVSDMVDISVPSVTVTY